MGKISKIIAAVAFVVGIFLYIGFPICVNDKIGNSRVSPGVSAGVFRSGQAPVNSLKNFAVGSDVSLTGGETPEIDIALPIWNLGDTAGLVILERAHPIYAQRIELNSGVLASLKVGDGFSMHIPQTARILSATLIERVVNRHSETLLASAHELEGIFAIQITISGESVFGNIETPEGIFVLEQQANVLEGAAVIFDEKEIYRSLDYRQSDAIPLER